MMLWMHTSTENWKDSMELTALGIKEFKRQIAGSELIVKKSMRNKMVKAYKKRAWMEYIGATRFKGIPYPSHPKYGRSMEVEGSKDTESPEYEVKVRNEKK